MSRFAFAVALVFTLLSTGCIRSVQPFYKDNQVVAPAELPGTWVDPNGENGTFVVNANPDGKSYAVEYADKNKSKTYRFEVTLAKVGDRTIADFVMQMPADAKTDDEPADVHHGFVVIEIKDHDSLRISALNHDWFKKQMEADPNLLKHEMVESDQYLLTGSTDEIQAFLIKHFDTEGAFGEPAEFRREGTEPEPPDSDE